MRNQILSASCVISLYSNRELILGNVALMRIQSRSEISRIFQYQHVQDTGKTLWIGISAILSIYTCSTVSDRTEQISLERLGLFMIVSFAIAYIIDVMKLIHCIFVWSLELDEHTGRYREYSYKMKYIKLLNHIANNTGNIFRCFGYILGSVELFCLSKTLLG